MHTWVRVQGLGDAQVKSWIRLARRKHGRNSSWKVRWVTTQASVLCRLVSFQSDWSMSDICGQLWSPIFSWEAESCWGRAWAFQRVILHGEAGSGTYSHLKEAGFTWLWWIQGTISATLTVVGVDKTTTKGPLQWDFSSWTFHSCTQTASPGLYGSCQDMESLSYPIVDFWVNPTAWICCIRLRSPIALRSPHRSLTKGGGCPKRISKVERPICLVGIDLILNKAMGSNWSHCRWVSWHSFPNCNFRVLFICFTFPKL
jgi:hypothetical protein